MKKLCEMIKTLSELSKDQLENLHSAIDIIPHDEVLDIDEFVDNEDEEAESLIWNP